MQQRTGTPISSARALLAMVTAMLAFAAPASGQATRTWVSGVGDDANPCSRTAPCKTFAGSISKTAAGGEINAIDSGGYGTLTIVKSITVDGAGVHASILNSGLTGVVVNAAPTDRVVLRNISIDGAGTPGCGTGVRGIRVLRAASVIVENVTLLNQSVAISIAPTAGAPNVSILGSSVLNGCPDGVGIDVAPAEGAAASVAIAGSRLVGNATALRVADRGNAYIAGSTVAHNALGFETVGAGVLTSHAGNLVFGNVADGSATSIAGLITGPEGPAGPQGPAGPAGAPGPAAPVSAAAGCTVPKLSGLTLTAAKKRIKQAGCKVGSVKRAKTKNAKRVGKVVKQSRKAGTSVAAGSKVGVTLGRR